MEKQYKGYHIDILFNLIWVTPQVGLRNVEMINDNPVLRKFHTRGNHWLFLNSSTGLYCIVQWYSEDRFSGIKMFLKIMANLLFSSITSN